MIFVSKWIRMKYKQVKIVCDFPICVVLGCKCVNICHDLIYLSANSYKFTYYEEPHLLIHHFLFKG